jgi:hypothetical protein
LGATLLDAGDAAAAEPSLRAGLALAPQSADGMATLGSALLVLGRLREGLQLLGQGYGLVRFDRHTGVSIHRGFAS